MDKTFTVNGKSYPVVEMDFNFMCELEDHGITIDNIADKPMKILREYLAIAAGNTSAWAGKEIEAHVVSGGDLTALYDVLNEAMESSGFFRAMANEPQENQEATGESKKTKKPAK